jgi:hypothetical protein
MQANDVIPEDAHEDDEMYSSLSSGQKKREELSNE